MNPIPPLCSSSIPSTTGEIIKQASPSEANRELDTLISRLNQLTPGTSDPSLDMDLKALLPKLQQNGFFGLHTPLTWAMTKPCHALFPWLLKHGARTGEADGYKKTILDYAIDFMELDARDRGLQDMMVRPNIYIFNPDKPALASFRATLQSSLEEIEKTQIGKQLLKKIRKAPYRILIKYNELENYCANKPEEPGKGCSTLIHYSGRETSYISTEGTCVVRPNFVGLFHELTHAYHNSMGKGAHYGTKCDKLVWDDDDEYNTIMGFPSKNPERKTPEITENALLAELHLPERISHLVFEGSKNFSAISLRIYATAALYRQFVKETHYEGQAHSPPPPRLIQVTPEYFGTSNKEMFFYRGVKMGKTVTVSVLNKYKSSYLPSNCCWINYPPHQWPPELELKKIHPAHSDVKVVEMGIYRLSEEEAKPEEEAAEVEALLAFEESQNFDSLTGFGSTSKTAFC